jgi:Leucine-rich repeat (LRR) protein
VVLGVLLCSTVVAEEAVRSPDDPRTDAAIRELVRQGAVVKRFNVLESETEGLLVRLKAEHLDREGSIAPDIVSTLRPLPELSLELRGIPFSDVGLKSLLKSVSLVGLDVSGSKISDRGMPAFDTQPRLRLLDLSFTRVSDQGLKSLTHLRELRYISLIGCQVTDIGTDSLTQLSRLREIYLTKSEVSSEAVENLRCRFPMCRIQR